MTASEPKRSTGDFSLTSAAGPYMTNSIRAYIRYARQTGQEIPCEVTGSFRRKGRSMSKICLILILTVAPLIYGCESKVTEIPEVIEEF